ncbi:hypothetical protein FRC19_003771 [Serendipita sp. 401]|nr:hypothetical protein FRC18_007426 [Serendipita sp. 400]KAG8811475.1 hypothetical protein FRC19_003771 [Serendipita sp. 401]
MSQQSQPVAIPAKESPRSQEEQASPVNSREASPSSSSGILRKRDPEHELNPFSGSKRKREEEEETQDVNVRLWSNLI